MLNRALLIATLMGMTVPALAAQQVIETNGMNPGVPPGLDHVVEALCPSGMKVTGGGHQLTAAAQRFIVAGSNPSVDASGWRVRVVNTDNMAQASNLTVYAICM